MRTDKRVRYQFDERFFKKIDTEYKAYYFGLLADGWLKYDKGGFRGVLISLNQCDRHILESFREVLGDTPELTMTKAGQARLNITSSLMANDLINLGMSRYKADRTNLSSHVPKRLWKHVVRGWIDADGSIVDEKYRIRYWVRGPEIVLKDLQSMIPIQTTLESEKIHNSLYTTKHQDGVELGNWLYKGSNIYLHRKYNKFSSALERRLSKQTSNNGGSPEEGNTVAATPERLTRGVSMRR